MKTGELCGRGRSEQVWLFPPSQMQLCLSNIYLSSSTELTFMNLGCSEFQGNETAWKVIWLLAQCEPPRRGRSPSLL